MAQRSLPVRRAMAKIGEHVTLMRNLNGTTAKATAARAGVSLTTLRNLERGENVGLDAALDILHAVGLLDQTVAGTDPLASEAGRARLTVAFGQGRRK